MNLGSKRAGIGLLAHAALATAVAAGGAVAAQWIERDAAAVAFERAGASEQPSRCGRTKAADVAPRIEQVFVSLDEGVAFGDALDELTTLTDTLAAHAERRGLESFAQADLARRYVEHLSLIDETLARGVFRELRNAPDAWSAMSLAARGDEDNIARSYAVLGQLLTERREAALAYPNLAAAIAVVHDGPRAYSKRVNENTATSEGPLALLDFFTSNARRLALDPGRMSVDALAFVVDATASVDDLEWALSRYGNNPAPGERFFEIDYDYDHFRYRRPKKITESGQFTLPAIKQHGGVCADQAFFAEQVAKACGVPSVYVVARGADIGHAWIGFFQSRGRRGAWDLDNGRYDEYKNIRGVTTDPKTGGTLADSELHILGSYFMASDMERAQAAAAIDTVARWSEREASIDETLADELGLSRRGGPRSNKISDRLDLLELGLNVCSSDRSGWRLMAEIAASGRMTPSQLDHWGSALQRMCGREFPDFSVQILGRMFDGIESARERSEMWEWAHREFGRRHDVAAEIRFRQGQLWLAEGNRELAWLAFDDIVTRYADKTSAIVDAVATMEGMLRSAGLDRDVLPMYRDVWARVPEPDTDASGEFTRASNWYRVGVMYAAAAKRAGDRTLEASIVRDLLSQ